MDFDAQANLTLSLGQKEAPTFYDAQKEIGKRLDDFIVATKYSNLWLLPSGRNMVLLNKMYFGARNFEYMLKDRLNKVKEQFDFILIDTPPSIEFYTLNALTASNRVLIPCQCDYLSTHGVDQVLRLIKLIREKSNPQIQSRILFTMLDRDSHASRLIFRKIQSLYQGQTFDTVIEMDGVLKEAQILNMPAIQYSQKKCRRYPVHRTGQRGHCHRRSIVAAYAMNFRNGYSLQRTMIIYMLLIGFAALLVASEFVLDTHSIKLREELNRNFEKYTNGELAHEQVYEPLVRIRNKAMMMVGVILAVVVIVLTMFIKTITEPLQHMVEVSKAISSGDLSQTTGVETGNELSQLSCAIDDMSTNLQEIIMLSRSVCVSAGRLTSNALDLLKKEQMTAEQSGAMQKQLVRLDSELTTLGQVIDFFKLYSVDDRA